MHRGRDGRAAGSEEGSTEGTMEGEAAEKVPGSRPSQPLLLLYPLLAPLPSQPPRTNANAVIAFATNTTAAVVGIGSSAYERLGLDGYGERTQCW
ncbi:hypothetical protein E2562_020323 [Oryza meyeriana var. granulata]|uniref:Uncharacterized protein n=1 Tax=Oryza meyeriana var. granulata TaxID=110450 RepID=A0A6G1EB20_9ORYZ|nr:hypothetical protein E2562_020323 [Oryza meyeriana var. granulata]